MFSCAFLSFFSFRRVSFRLEFPAWSPSVECHDAPAPDVTIDARLQFQDICWGTRRKRKQNLLPSVSFCPFLVFLSMFLQRFKRSALAWHNLYYLHNHNPAKRHLSIDPVDGVNTLSRRLASLRCFAKASHRKETERSDMKNNM